MRPRRDLTAMREEVKKKLAGEHDAGRSGARLRADGPACEAGGHLDVEQAVASRGNQTERAKGRPEEGADESEPPERISLIDALVGDSLEKIVDRLDGFALARLSLCSRDLFKSSCNQYWWQSKCHKEWGSEGWFGPETNEVMSHGPTARALGNKVVQRAESSGIAVDQLTLNKLESYPIPARKTLLELASCGQLLGANNLSPFDGLAFEETLGSRPGGVGSSGIDWKNTYKTLSGMLAMCHIYTARAAIAAPGNRKKKLNAVINGMQVIANWISLSVCDGKGKYYRRLSPLSKKKSKLSRYFLSLRCCNFPLCFPLQIRIAIPGEEERTMIQIQSKDLRTISHKLDTEVLYHTGNEKIPSFYLEVSRDRVRQVKRMIMSIPLNNISSNILSCAAWNPLLMIKPNEKNSSPKVNVVLRLTELQGKLLYCVLGGLSTNNRL
uniref:F-box domain-containing protein n=1 Tax=Guillardia theta TaxID=55529 RepID=A0A7S4U7U2_GUITH